MKPRRLIDWLKSWFVGAGVVRQVASIRYMLEDLVGERDQVLKLLEDRRKGLDDLFAQIEEQGRQLAVETERNEALIKRYESELEALRSKLQIAEEITIPGLIASSEVMKKGCEAELAVQSRRQAIAMPGERSEL